MQVRILFAKRETAALLTKLQQKTSTRHGGVREDAAMLLMGDCCPQTPAAQDMSSAEISTAEMYSDESTAKLHHAAPPAYTPSPYLDSPPIPCNHTSPVAIDTPQPRTQRQPLTFPSVSSADYVPDYSPPSRPSFSSNNDNDDDIDDENVPLGRLLSTPCDAPPAYSSVVRHSYRETLRQHIPRCSSVDVDEEAALERVCADELAFEVERAVAMAVVMALMMLAGVLVGLLFLRKGA
jgi:hypothetical protein